MDNKPLITYAGDVPVFQGVVPSLQKGIGSEAVEWKRAYGRSTKHVHLHPRFIPFDEESMCTATASETPLLTSLLDQPMLHTYWTDCSDVEIYRQTTKDGIQSWLNLVKTCNVKEWLIILVEPADNKKANKLLPRSSVLDKIKNDFAQKQTERCVCLSDPSKLDSKSAESLHSMLHRIRQLLLASYSKTLTKFEENMRAQREKRNEIGWNFCHYFLLQEELAFVLEMLEVYDEALVQYDELDALFTQFVLNSHLTDTPQWLLSFQRFGDRWPALCLSSSCPHPCSVVLSKIRETVKNSSVSLLNFRNYLFARQALLLLKQRRINELAGRSLAFLHNCINELAILDVAFSEEGSVSSWVFVSCLEILATICGHTRTQENVENSSASNSGVDPLTPKDNKKSDAEGNGPANIKQKNNRNLLKQNPVNHTMLGIQDFSVHTASLWDYAREKLYDLGKLCGLLPKSQLKSDHLHKVITLSAGLTSFDSNDSDSVIVNTNGNKLNGSDIIDKEERICASADLESPIERLKDALSSKDKFQHHYLELCELAMGTYKHIGRLRSARKVGLSLASYYMEGEEWIKASVFLVEALKTYKTDRWGALALDVLLKLAQCFQATEDTDRYIRTCAQLACSRSLDDAKRNHFFDEMMTCISQLESKDRFIMSPTEETFVLNNVSVETSGKISQECCDVRVKLDLTSNLPRPVLATVVQMSILPCDHVPTVMGFSTSGAFYMTNNKSSSSSSSSIKGGRKHGSRGSGDNLSDSGKTAKEKVGRKESATTPILTCEDEDVALALLETNPAVLKLDFSQQLEVTSKEKTSVQGGKLMCHDTHQSLRRKDSQVKGGDLQVSKTDFSEAAKAVDIIINAGASKIELSAKLSSPGIFRLCQVSIGVKQFELLGPRMGCRYKFSVDKVPPNIQLGSDTQLVAGIEQILTISLDAGSYYISEGMMLLVRASMGLQLKLDSDSASDFTSELSIPLPPTESFNQALVTLRVKADLGPQKDNSPIEHRITAKCPWTSEERKLGVVFLPPFMSSHKLHSVGKRKFVQIVLQGLTSTPFTLSEHSLSVQPQDIPLVQLNPRSQSLVVRSGKSAAYMWEIGLLDWNDEHPLRLEFLIKFQTESHASELYKYYICLQRLKTLYELQSRVEPHKGTEFCRVGNMCTLVINISKYDVNKRVQDEDQVQNYSVMYEVRADKNMWSICGQSNGVVSMDGNDSTQQVSLDVMPNTHGYLPIPAVNLTKYIPADPKSGNSSVPKFEPFNVGQVYNKGKGSQIHVLPPPQSIGGSTSGLSGGSGGGSSLPPTNDTHF